MIKLSPQNYHSAEARRQYMSASRFKDYHGSLGLVGCEARALAMDKGEWTEESTEAMLVSSYVDSHFAGTLDVFKAQHPEILKKDGSLMAKYEHMNTVIARIERDEYMMKCLSGDKQVILTAKMFGCDWSCAIDSRIKGVANVDLKVMANINKAHYVKDYGQMSFIQYYGYIGQAAIYTAIDEKVTGKRVPFLFAVASKEEEPDIAVIGCTEQDINDELIAIERAMPRIIAIRAGNEKPDSCGKCAYCRHEKKLSGPVHFSELVLSI